MIRRLSRQRVFVALLSTTHNKIKRTLRLCVSYDTNVFNQFNALIQKYDNHQDDYNEHLELLFLIHIGSFFNINSPSSCKFFMYFRVNCFLQFSHIYTFAHQILLLRNALLLCRMLYDHLIIPPNIQ